MLTRSIDSRENQRLADNIKEACVQYDLFQLNNDRFRCRIGADQVPTQDQCDTGNIELMPESLAFGKEFRCLLLLRQRSED